MPRVTDVVTLGTPHLGAPLERGVALGARALGALPESAPFGRILEYRSTGILDLRAGLAKDVQNLPHARYHLVAATLAASRRHPVSEVLGDLLVRYPSATGRPRRGPEMFPGPTCCTCVVATSTCSTTTTSTTRSRAGSGEPVRTRPTSDPSGEARATAPSDHRLGPDRRATGPGVGGGR